MLLAWEEELVPNSDGYVHRGVCVTSFTSAVYACRAVPAKAFLPLPGQLASWIPAAVATTPGAVMEAARSSRYCMRRLPRVTARTLASVACACCTDSRGVSTGGVRTGAGVVSGPFTLGLIALGGEISTRRNRGVVQPPGPRGVGVARGSSAATVVGMVYVSLLGVPSNDRCTEPRGDSTVRLPPTSAS